MTKFEVLLVKELVKKDLELGQEKGLDLEQIKLAIDHTFETITKSAAS